MAMRKRRAVNVQQMLRSDGALCVTFVNTGYRKPLDLYDGLLAWGAEVGALATTDVQRLGRLADERPGLAGGVCRRALTLRARLERMLLALAAGDKATKADFQAFDVELRAALANRHQIETTSGYRWAWAADVEDDLDRMLWPVLLSTAELLTSEDRSRVRQCAGQGCGLLFIARNAGRRRKWCGPACGERARSADHYRKKVGPKRRALKRQYQQHTGVRMEIEAFRDEDGSSRRQ